jgi:hypothetical protein
VGTVSGEWWQLDLAAKVDEHCVTLCHPDGVGALQLSAYQRRDGKVVRKQDLLSATKLTNGQQRHLGEQDWGEFHGYQLVYAEDDTFWRRWWLANGRTFLFVTYNCDKADMEVE